MLPEERRYYAGAVAVLAAAFTLFCALTAASAHTQGVCSVPGDHATIQTAVDDPACETVNLGAGTFYESVTISRTVTIQGQGVDLTIVDGENSSDPIFAINDNGVATLTGMTLQNLSLHHGLGSAIWNDGLVTLANCTLRGNLTSRVIANNGTMTVINSTLSGNSGEGGVISNSGTMTVTYSTLRGNQAGCMKCIGGGAIQNDATMTVIDSTLSGNLSQSGGGGIFNFGTMTVIDSTLSGNTSSGVAFGAEGGGIDNWGTMTLSNSTLHGNSARKGGGIYNSGTMTVTNSTLSDNYAQGLPAEGGGICNSGTMTVTNSTLSDNYAQGIRPGEGGGILNYRTMTVINSTLSGNTADEGGGVDNWGTLTLINSTLSGNSVGIYNSGTVQVTNSIVANSPSGADCSGSITSLGHNIDSDGSCGLTGPGDLPNTDPILRPLGHNGFPTPTHDLLEGSPAIDAGSDACPATDQRGVPRPVDGDGDGVKRCDIGAVESVGGFRVFLPLIER